jgi:hypothetical protein
VLDEADDFIDSDNPVAVEKGTKAVIAVNFCVRGERTFNNLQTNFVAETP